MTQLLQILIVEDEAMIAMCIEMELTRAGYGICQQGAVATGEKAVIIAQRESPDIILMDIRLAGEIDGIEAAQQIQACADIPIIFMTGYPDKAVEERAKKLNPLGYFVKPVQNHMLQPLIDSTGQSHDTQKT